MIERKVEPVGRFEKHTLPNGSFLFYEPDPKHAYYGEIKENKRSEGGYSYVQASRFVGVSTPVKALDSNVDPLLYWAAGLDQVGIADLVDRQIASGCTVEDLEWLRSPKQIAQALRDHELTWADVRDRAAQRGTNVHERVFLALATGRRPPSLSKLSAEERAYGQAAIRWWKDNRPTPLYAEQVTLSTEHDFAGRFDLLCEIDGERVLVDAKTREKGKSRRSDHAQLRGYEIANRECGIGKSDRQISLLLMPDGTYNPVDCVATDGDFLSGLDSYRRGGDLEKRMRAAAKAAKEEKTAVPA